MSVETVPMDDKAMFEAAMSDDAPATEAPAQEAVVEQIPDADRPRDEHGRFAKVEAEAKTEEVKSAEAKPAEQQPEKDAAQVPSWRLAEVSEARRAAEARAAEIERRSQEYAQQIHHLTAQVRQLTEKAPEPIDPYIDPEKFADQRARQAVDPVRSQVAGVTEHYSKEFAVMAHGAETVQQAYDWVAKGLRTDPQVQAVYQRAMNSIDPYKEIVMAFKRDKALATVGDDPNVWFEKELERRKLTDPEFAAKLKPAQAASPTNIVKLPPSLNRAASGGNKPEDTGDDSDASIFAYATKR